MTIDPTITFGNLLTVGAILLSVGFAWARLSFLETQIKELKASVILLQQVMTTQSGELQRVIGAFELHVRTQHEYRP